MKTDYVLYLNLIQISISYIEQLRALCHRVRSKETFEKLSIIRMLHIESVLFALWQIDIIYHL